MERTAWRAEVGTLGGYLLGWMRGLQSLELGWVGPRGRIDVGLGERDLSPLSSLGCGCILRWSLTRFTVTRFMDTHSGHRF